MQVRDVMTRQVSILTPDSTIGEAAAIMATNDDGLIVIIAGGALAGVVTDRDLVVRGLAQGEGRSTMLSEVMTDEVVTLGEAESGHEAAVRMASECVSRIIVVDDDGDVIGLVSLGHLVREYLPEALDVAAA